MGAFVVGLALGIRVGFVVGRLVKGFDDVGLSEGCAVGAFVIGLALGFRVEGCDVVGFNVGVGFVVGGCV